jgi:hypothetical protein
MKLLSWGSVDMPALLAEVTQVQEAAVVVESTCDAAVIAAEASTREATTA